MRRLFLIILFSFVIGVFCVPTVTQAQFFFLAHPLIGKQAPDFTLDTTQRKKEDFSRYREGKPAIIFFWATWCPHCRTQLKELNEKSEEIQKQGIALVLIDLEETASQVRSYLDRNNINLPIFLDSDGSVASNYRIAGVPTYFFVTKEGVIKDVQHYITDEYKDVLFDTNDGEG